MKLSEHLGPLIVRVRKVVLRAAALALSQRDINVINWQIVRQLAVGGPSSQRDLADAVAQHPAGVCRQLEELEAQGLTRREGDPTDKRKLVVELTPRGREWYRKHYTPVFAAVDEALAPLTEEEQQQLMTLLSKLDTPGATKRWAKARPKTRSKPAAGAKRRSPRSRK